ncbi:MAG: hypothetical protein AAB410_03530 [Patescibacteria group bacterium]
MSRPYHKSTLQILEELDKKNDLAFSALHKLVSSAAPYKEFYNNLFRMSALGLIEKNKIGKELSAKITEEGRLLLSRKRPEKDGVWKLVIFDIPEKHKKIRNILRAKLKQLYFKKWQNSIWISPYALDREIESEFQDLGKKFFIRLIKTTDINNTDDFKKLFP